MYFAFYKQMGCVSLWTKVCGLWLHLLCLHICAANLCDLTAFSL